MIQFTPVGDSGVLAVCGSEISEQVNAQVMALDAAVQAAQLPGVVETVPTYAALLVTLDPLQTDADTMIPALRRLWDALPPVSSTAAGRLVEVPVCYGGDYGPDLAFVAQHAGLFVRQQDVFVLVDDAQLGIRHGEVGVVLPGLVKKLVVDIQLQDIALLQPGVPVDALAVALDALDADIFLRQGRRKQRNCLRKKAV